MTATCALWGQQIWSERAPNGQNISSRRLIRNTVIVHPNRTLSAHDGAPEQSEGLILTCTPYWKTRLNKCCRAAGAWWINCCSISHTAKKEKERLWNNPKRVIWPDTGSRSNESQLLNGSFLPGHGAFPLTELHWTGVKPIIAESSATAAEWYILFPQQSRM